MLATGNIIYFTPFFFTNGNPSKNKYFIVLKELGNTSIIASLPSSKDFVPSVVVIKHGCIDIPEADFNCYHFEAKRSVTDAGFCFELPTFVYGDQVFDCYKNSLLKDYPKEGTHYTIKGKLSDGEYSALLNCIKQSPSVKRKIKRYLQ